MRRWATFDCYGTLIDWNGGISATLERLWPDEDASALLASYHALEPVVQRDCPGLSYRGVMARCLRGIADAEGLALAVEEEGSLGSALPGWPVFPEVPGALAELRHGGWSLAILSNTDADLLAASVERIGVPFDELVIASEIGSYKPAHGHWLEFFERTGARREQHVHVAASLFHDIAPACELGLSAVWINRLDERAARSPTRELPDLSGLPDILRELVP